MTRVPLLSSQDAIATVVDRIHRDVIGGAADISKEVMAAIMNLVKDSKATSIGQLATEVDQAVIDILRVLPSFAPPLNALNRLLITLEANSAEDQDLKHCKSALEQVAEEFYVWSENALNKVAQYGAEKIEDGSEVFMYSMSSTVWRILHLAKSQGKSFHLTVTESRPANEGLWSVDEMLKIEVPVSASIDACIGELVPRADVVFVGADAVSSQGFVFCKVGTYPTALVAKRNNVPFYVAADTLKFDSSSLLGIPFRAEPLNRQEVLGDRSSLDVQVIGTLFDETPPDLITGIITEIGILPPTACATVMQQMRLSTRLSELIPSWAHGNL